MIIKNFLSTLISCILLSACFEVPVEEATIAPKGTRIEALTAEQVLQENSPESLQFQPVPNSKIRYYDAQGNLSDSAVKGGFYRKVLGKTPHNRLVLQDFYQENDQPYTLPFVAVADAQLKFFHGATVRDSRTVWLKPDGSVMRVSEFRNGKAIGETWFYERNKPMAYIKLLNELPQTSAVSLAASADSSANNHTDMALNKKNTRKIKPNKSPTPIKEKIATADEYKQSLSQGAALMHFFYSNGHLMAEIETDGKKQHKVNLYYPNGATMLQIEDDGIQSAHAAWDVKGQKIAPAEVSVEADVLALRIEYGLNLMGRAKGSLANLLLK